MSNVVKAIQAIYPNINGGFVYWESKQDGSPLDHPQDGLIWENTKYSKPSWDDIEAQLNTIDINELKTQYYAELKTLRECDCIKPYIYNGTSFKATEAAQNKLSNVSDLFDTNITSINWFDIDNNSVSLTKDDIHKIKVGIYNRSFALYDKEIALSNIISAINDLTQLQAYDVEAEWNK